MDLTALPSGGAEASTEHALETCQHWQESQQATELSLGAPLHSVLRTKGGGCLGHSLSSVGVLRQTHPNQRAPWK